MKSRRSEVSVNSKNESGSSGLHEAAWAGHLELCELLLLEGAEAFQAFRSLLEPFRSFL